MFLIVDSKSNHPYFLYVSFTMVHAPFQDVTKKFSAKETASKNIRDGMITALDKAVGEISEVVKHQKNTVLIFMSDNGGRNYPDSGIETNTPLRGGKAQVYEGGTRVVGLVQGPGFKQHVRYNGLMHMVDWLPTLVSMGGGDTSLPSSLDGLDMSHAIKKVKNLNRMRRNYSKVLQANGNVSPRHEMVYNIDENNFHNGPGASEEFWQVGIRRGQYKLVWGQAGMLKKSGRKIKLELKSQKKKKNTKIGDHELLLELFDIQNDPYEENNLAKDKTYQKVLLELKQRTLVLATEMVKNVGDIYIKFVILS